MHNFKLETMSNAKTYHFHVAFFTNESKTILSGKTYKCENILDSIEMYIHDVATPSMSRIKYISCEENMSKTELREIRYYEHGK